MADLITANELKTKGLTALDRAISNGNEAIITVRGKTHNDYMRHRVKLFRDK